jgi:hypothetical protein
MPNRQTDKPPIRNPMLYPLELRAQALLPGWLILTALDSEPNACATVSFRTFSRKEGMEQSRMAAPLDSLFSRH